MTLLSLPDCARESGVAPKTLYRWIEAGKLLRRRNGLVDLDAVRRIKSNKRMGRNYGLSAAEKMRTLGDAHALASPFLQGPRGLALFETVAGLVVAHHSQTEFMRGNARRALARVYALL